MPFCKCASCLAQSSISVFGLCCCIVLRTSPESASVYSKVQTEMSPSAGALAVLSANAFTSETGSVPEVWAAHLQIANLCGRCTAVFTLGQEVASFTILS